MVMSSAGRDSIRIGQTEVPVAAFANLIGTLAQRTASQQNAAVRRESMDTPEYLVNLNGELICDPMDSEQRADVLLELLGQEYFYDAQEWELEDQEEEEYLDEEIEERLIEELIAVQEEEDDDAWEEELEELFSRS